MGAKFIKSKFQLILQMKRKIREEKIRKKMLTSKKRKTDLGDALSVRRLRFRISRFYFSVYLLVF